MSLGLVPEPAITCRMASQVARHQSRGSCSAHPVSGEAKGACSAVREATTVPCPSMSTARVPPVPTSIPNNLDGMKDFQIRIQDESREAGSVQDGTLTTSVTDYYPD